MSKTSMKSPRRETQAQIKRESVVRKLYPYLWILPSVLLAIVILLVPIIDLFITSFSEVSTAGVRRGFNGLSNYTSLFQDGTFLMVLKNTVIWTVGIVGISVILSLGIAVLLNERFRGRRLVRSVLIVPWAVSLVITSIIWRYILDFRYGTLNLVLQKLGLIEESINWLGSPTLALSAMIWVGVLVSIPFISFVLLAGLQSISSELYEAAKVDGASKWASFFYITLPQLKSSLTVSVVLSTIYVFNSFPIVWTITRGDPLNRTDIVFTYLYKLGFDQRQIGQAGAISVISFVILLAFSILYVSLLIREEN